MKTFKQFQEETVAVNELFGLGKPKPKPKKSLARKVVGGAAKLAGKVVKKVGSAAVKGAAGAVSGAAKGIAAGLRDHYEIGEAKVDTVKYGTLSSPAKEKARNERKFGKVGWNQGGQSQLRKGAHWDKRGEKKIKGQKPAPKGAYGEEVVLELNRYGKETGKATGSINKRAGTPIKIGGSTDKALNFVRTKIRKETGKPEGQQKKVKGEKGRIQYGDRKGTPADTIAKRRQSKADAEKLMRDTSGT